MHYKRTVILAACLLVLWATVAAGALAPVTQVQATVDQVIITLRDKALQGEVRRTALSRLIRARFDFVIMSQRTLGVHWKEASPEEQKRFAALFADLLEASYIGRIEAYSDETVSYAGEKIDGDRAEVATLIRSGNTDIPIDYRLVRSGEEWYVYDVIVEGVSLIKNYRSSYGEIVRKEGFAGLFGRMEAKISEIRQAPAGGSGK